MKKREKSVGKKEKYDCCWGVKAILSLSLACVITARRLPILCDKQTYYNHTFLSSYIFLSPFHFPFLLLSFFPLLLLFFPLFLFQHLFLPLHLFKILLSSISFASSFLRPGGRARIASCDLPPFAIVYA